VLPASVASKVKVAFVWLVGVGGPEVIVVFGAVRSITQVKLAGDGSVLLAASVARTSKVCVPAAKPVKFRGLVQAANAAVSNRHWNVLPASFDVNEKLAVVAVVTAAGLPVMLVSGGVISAVVIVHV
jgi:hypothetical protein